MLKKTALVGLALVLVFVFGARTSASSRPAPQVPAALTGTVTFVYDGDTIRVRLDSGGEKKVRLIGVDAPEFDDPQESVRLSAFLARRFAFSKLNQKPVRLTADREKEDAYGRLLAYVWTDGAAMFNEVLVREGFATAYLKFPFDEAVKTRLREAEAEARRAGRGLWAAGPRPVVGAGEARGRVGQVVTVRFRCVRTFERARFRVLVPSEGEFEAVVPVDVLASFPGSLDFEKKIMEVTGLVEEYKGRPQVVIGLPVQVKVVGPAD
jgi:micrococcal nuclease